MTTRYEQIKDNLRISEHYDDRMQRYVMINNLQDINKTLALIYDFMMSQYEKQREEH